MPLTKEDRQEDGGRQQEANGGEHGAGERACTGVAGGETARAATNDPPQAVTTKRRRT